MNPAPDETLAEAASALARALLAQYDDRVSERGTFPDFQVGRTIQFGDPDVALPGRVELIVLNMNREIDPQFNEVRVVSIRVRRSPDGGFCSMSSLHGTKQELRARLEELVSDPEYLVERIEELSQGLPEETDPRLWR